MYRVSMICAWVSFLVGAAAFLLLIVGFRASFSLPTPPRPRVGLGLSEAGDVLFGSAFYGWWIAGFGALFGLVAILVPGRRRFKLLLALPAVAYFLTPLVLATWGEIRRAL